MHTCIRIQAARAAFARAAWVRGQMPSYDEDAIVDMLIDLRLWCRSIGADFSRCDHMAWLFLHGQEASAS